MIEHTKLPWRNQCFQVYGADNSRIAHTGMGQLPPYRASESEANAAFIVKVVNQFDAHEAVANAALEMVACDVPSSPATIDRLRAALNDLMKAKAIGDPVGISGGQGERS